MFCFPWPDIGRLSQVNGFVLVLSNSNPLGTSWKTTEHHSMLDFALRSFNGLKHTAHKSWCTQLKAQLHAWGGCRGHAILINNIPSHVSSWNRLTLFQTGEWGQRRAISWPLHFLGECLLATRVTNITKGLVSTNLQKACNMSWRENIGLRPDLLSPAFLQTWKKTQGPWLFSCYPGLPIGTSASMSCEWLEWCPNLKDSKTHSTFLLF